MLLYWVEGVAIVTTLVTVPPEGGIYYSQVNLVWSSEDDWLWLSLPLSPVPQKGATDDREGLFCPNELVSMLGEKLSSPSAVHLWKLQPDDDISYNAHVSPLECLSAIIQEKQASL
jgi:hypothetical protein